MTFRDPFISKIITITILYIAEYSFLCLFIPKSCNQLQAVLVSKGTCWMKGGVATKSDAVVTADKSMVCGVITSNPGLTKFFIQ